MDNFKWIRVQEQDHPVHGGQVMIAFMLYNQGPFHQGGRYDCGVWEIGSKANKNVTVLAWAEIPRFKPLLVVDGTESDGFTLSECGCNAPFWVFNVDTQENVSGPYRTRQEADDYFTLPNPQQVKIKQKE